MHVILSKKLVVVKQTMTASEQNSNKKIVTMGKKHMTVSKKDMDHDFKVVNES